MNLILCIIWQISAKGWQLWACITVLISEAILPRQIYYFVVKEWVRTATGKKRLWATSPGYYHCQQSTWPVGHAGSLQETNIYTPVRTLSTLGWHPKFSSGLYLGVFLIIGTGRPLWHLWNYFSPFFFIRKWQEHGKNQPDGSKGCAVETQLLPTCMPKCPENNGALCAHVCSLRQQLHTLNAGVHQCVIAPLTANASWGSFEQLLSFGHGHRPVSFLGLLESIIQSPWVFKFIYIELSKVSFSIWIWMFFLHLWFLHFLILNCPPVRLSLLHICACTYVCVWQRTHGSLWVSTHVCLQVNLRLLFTSHFLFSKSPGPAFIVLNFLSCLF